MRALVQRATRRRFAAATGRAREGNGGFRRGLSDASPSGKPQPTPIVVLGINVVDCKLDVPRLPSKGETVLSTSTSEDFGGKGANQAVQASLLLGSQQVSFVSSIGDDARGRATRAALETAGVDCSHLALDPVLPTGFAAVMVDPHGANAIVVAPGANAMISSSDVQNAAPLFQDANIVMCQLEASMDASLAAFTLAGKNRPNGALKILNAAPIPTDPHEERLQELCHACDVLCVNEVEAAQLLGWESFRVLSDMGREAASALLGTFPRTSSVVLTLGERGVCLIERDILSGQLSETVTLAAVSCEAKDTVGAGDSFLGALAVALSRGETMRDAASFATQIAGLSVQFPGTQASYYAALDVFAARASTQGTQGHDAAPPP